MYLAIKMKKFPLLLAVIIFTFSCGTKRVIYNNQKQQPEKELKANGLLATCIQHEIDHLNGILFIDYLSKLKKDMIIKKLVKHKKEIERVIV